MLLFVFLYLTLQATERIKEYAIIIITESLISVLISTILVLCGYKGYKYLVLLDVIGRGISLLIAIYYCKDYVFLRPHIEKEHIKKAILNIRAGAMVLFATLSSSIIVGISRFAVQQSWGIEAFSKISLTVSISNMATRCINAVGIVMFPALRKLEKEKLPEIYKNINTLLLNLIFAAFIFYKPAVYVLGIWLPKYSDSLKYAAILLPVCAYECKNVMLISTYLKTLFKEKMLLLSNVIAIAMSLIGTIISVYLFNSMEAVMISLLVSLMVRCVISELYIGRILAFRTIGNVISESIMVLSFIICNWYMGLLGFVLYLLIDCVYLYMNRVKLSYYLGQLVKRG